MSLTPGTLLGAHEIVGLLGAGGMGEVYRARDTKLNRQVAIKVLPDAYASDPDRVARFHREAQAVAALNHPNVEHSPHGSTLGDAQILLNSGRDRNWTLALFDVKSRQLTPVPDGRSIEPIEGAISPDGRWFSYQARPAAASLRQVFVQPLPPNGTKFLVREGGHPYWRTNSELILNVGPGQSAAVPFTTRPRVSFGQPAEFSRVARNEGAPSTSRRNVDAMPDGRRVIGVMTAGALAATESSVHVVLNWFTELNQRVPRQ